MGLSKSTRIMILLGIDTAFFLLELVVGELVAVKGMPFAAELTLLQAI